ncbi:MAG: MFS transporter [Alphaproteobacteria bacterium]|nr:MFS transporter [Alphaproteobacteria bacterium]
MTIQPMPAERLYTWRYAPPFMRPPFPITAGNMRVLGLVGVASLLSGYDVQIFGLVAKQFLAEFGRETAATGPTVALFRMGVFGALALCLLADVIGRRALLLLTMAGMALGTLATAFAPTFETAVAAQFVTRVFAYAEDMLCIVVIAEEIEERSRGWAIGVLAALGALGAGVAILTFAAVDILPHGWRGIYVIGAVPLLLLAWMRRGLPETRRFQAMRAARERRQGARDMWRPITTLLRLYPFRAAHIMGIAFLFAFGTAPAIILLPTYLQSDRAFAPWMVTAIYIGTGLFGLLVSIAIGRVSDKVGRRPVMVTGLLLATAGFAALYAAEAVWLIVVGVLFGIFSQLTVNTQYEAVTAEIFPTAYRATASALRYIGGIVGGSVSLLLHGTVLTEPFGFAGAVLILLMPLPLAILGVLLLPETAGRRLEDITPETA